MTRRALRPALVIAILIGWGLGPTGCGRQPEAAKAGPAEAAKAYVTLLEVEARGGPTASAAAVAKLARGTEVRIGKRMVDFFEVPLPGAAPGWVPSGSFEREGDRRVREQRAKAVASFPAQPGRALETCPVFLAPDYGAARWGELSDGDDVEVLLFDHDFYGIRLPDTPLAFVPGRSIRLLPSEAVESEPAAAGKRRGPVPVIEPEPDVEPPAGGPVEVPIEPREAVVAPKVELPVLLSAPEPRYPDVARRMGISGEVVLRIVVEADGSVGGAEVIKSAPGGLTESALDAVKKRRYRPGRIDGQPSAMTAQVRVSFTLDGR